ncbi:SPOR domain-containing protein [Neisseriaceae bacterium B1]
MLQKKLLIALVSSLSMTGVHAANDMVVQVGSFHNAQFAAQQSAKTALVGVNTQVVEVRQNDTVYYRVRTRPMPQDAAERIMQTLNQNNIPAMILGK